MVWAGPRDAELPELAKDGSQLSAGDWSSPLRTRAPGLVGVARTRQGCGHPRGHIVGRRGVAPSPACSVAPCVGATHVWRGECFREEGRHWNRRGLAEVAAGEQEMVGGTAFLKTLPAT